MENEALGTQIENYDTFPIVDDSSVNGDDSGENVATFDEVINSIGFGKYQFFLFIFAGIAWTSDGMEILVLSMLTNTLKFEWGLTTFKVSLMISIVFLGSFIGSPGFGLLSDKFGRKRTLVASALCLAIASVGSAFATNFSIFLLCRFFVGVGFGGNIQIDTYCTEITPTKYRGHAIYGIMLGWPVGGLLAVIIAHFTGLENGAWHQWLMWLSIPSVIFFIVSLLIPESSRYLMQKGNYKSAMENLKRMAKINNVDFNYSRITVDNNQVDFSIFKELHILKLTASICFIWFSTSAVYYGIILYITQTVESNTALFHYNSTDVSNFADYKFYEYVISTGVEIPGYFMGLLLIEIFGRKKGCFFSLIAIAICFLTLLAPIKDIASVIILCIARMIIVGPNTTLFLYTNELFPTNLRSFTLGLCNTFYRVGGMVTPYIAEFLYRDSKISLDVVYGIWSIVTLLVICTLRETKGKPLD